MDDIYINIYINILSEAKPNVRDADTSRRTKNTPAQVTGPASIASARNTNEDLHHNS